MVTVGSPMLMVMMAIVNSYQCWLDPFIVGYGTLKSDALYGG